MFWHKQICCYNLFFSPKKIIWVPVWKHTCCVVPLPSNGDKWRFITTFSSWWFQHRIRLMKNGQQDCTCFQAVLLATCSRLVYLSRFFVHPTFARISKTSTAYWASLKVSFFCPQKNNSRSHYCVVLTYPFPKHFWVHHLQLFQRWDIYPPSMEGRLFLQGHRCPLSRRPSKMIVDCKPLPK